jgi:hypothetical protein
MRRLLAAAVLIALVALGTLVPVIFADAAESTTAAAAGTQGTQEDGPSAPSGAIPTSIATLNSAGEELHGQTVRFKGEVIGDVIYGSEGKVWLTVRDEHGAISVIVSADLVAQIADFGRYQVRGDTVEVSGVFHLSCSEHDGLTDVHATELDVVASGGPESQPFDIRLLIAGLVLAGVGAVLSVVYRLLVERSR